MIFLEASYVVFRATLFGLQRFKLIWILALISNISKMIMVGFVAAFHGGVVELAWGLIIAVGLMTVTAGFLVWRLLPPGEKRADSPPPAFREIWRYVLPLLGARSFFMAGQHLTRAILGAFLASRELGLISFAIVTTERFVALAYAIPISLLPSMSRLRGLKDHAGIEKILAAGFRITAALALIFSVVLFTLAREIIVILGGFDYMDAMAALQIMSLVFLFRTINQPFNVTFYTFEKTRIVFWLAGVKLIVELGLYPLLIPLFGINGVAIASVTSSVAVFIPAMIAVGRIFPATQGARVGVALKTWLTAAILVVAAAFVLKYVPLIWPSLLVRINLVLIGLILGIILIRLVRSEDIARLRSEIRSPTRQKILAGMEALLERAEGVVGN
jgi:O-antigen/teichoic acid export membrane protein